MAAKRYKINEGQKLVWKFTKTANASKNIPSQRRYLISVFIHFIVAKFGRKDKGELRCSNDEYCQLYCLKFASYTKKILSIVQYNAMAAIIIESGITILFL